MLLILQRTGRIGIPLVRQNTLLKATTITTSRRHITIDHNAIVTTMTESFQAIHEYSGLPWWALIPITTFTLRTIWTLPLAILQRKRIQKQAQLRPLVSAMNPVLKLNLAKKVQQAQAKLKQAEAAGDYTAVQSMSTLANMKHEQILLLSAKEMRKRQKTLFAKNDVQIWKNFILPAFQIPLWIIMSITMRNLSGWSSWDYTHNKALDPSLYTEGALWFPDLTIADPMHVFPVILGITALCNIEWTLKTLELLRLTKKLKFRPTLTDAFGNLTKLSIVFMMGISLHAPAALTVYWISSQIYSLFQNVIMDLAFPINFTPKTRFDYKKSKNDDAVNVIN